jgi:PAS domain S-box-containing protein
MFSHFSIRRKLFLALAGTGLVALLLAGGSQRLFEHFTFKKRVVSQLEALGDMVAISFYAAVDFNDIRRAETILAALGRHPDLLSARLYVNDEEFARWVRPGTASPARSLAPADGPLFGRDRVVVTRSLKVREQTFARLVLESSFATQQREFDDAMKVLALVGLVAFGLSLLAAGLLQRFFTAPLIELTHAAESVHASRDFSVRVEVKARDEVGRLATSLNTMLAGIEERDRQLAASHALLRSVVEGSGVAVISTDPGGVVRIFNPAAERLLGYSAAEVIGRRNPTVWHDPNEMAQRAVELAHELRIPVPSGFETLVAKVRQGPPEGREWTYVRRDGQRVPVYLVVSALREATGAILGYCGVATDLTERQRTEQALQALTQNTAGVTGREFFAATVQQLAGQLGTRWALIGERFLDGGRERVRTLARWAGGSADNYVYDLQGSPCEQVMAQPFCVYPDHVADLFPADRALAEAGVVSYVGIAIRDNSGRVIGHVAVLDNKPLTDTETAKLLLAISATRIGAEMQRLQTDAEIRSSEERLRLVWESTTEALRLIDSEGRVVAVNGAYCRLVGLPREKLIGQPMEDVVGEDQRAAVRARFENQFRSRTATPHWEREFLLWDGRRIWIEGSNNFVETDPARPLMLGIFRDISDRKAAVEAIRQLNTDLERRVQERTAELAARVTEVERLNAELGTSQRLADRAAAGLQEANSNLLVANQELEAFSYSVSHDLRAPLRNITGFIQLLRKRADGQLDAESNRFLGTVVAETARMGLLIDDLLTFSRLGRAEMKLQPVRLAELIEAVKAELHPDLVGRTIEWRLSPLPLVRGDRALLHQVVSNLVANAVKFTRRRPLAVIEIGASTFRPGDPRVTIFVRDNGAGFNPKYLDKLFGVFQRLHNAKDFEGTGIGLANVKRIITRHGGRVWAEGAVDQGATFYFSLPPSGGVDRLGSPRNEPVESS